MSKVSINYVTDKGYCPNTVHGFVGGFEATGELVLHFFTERLALAEREEICRNKKGELVDHRSIGAGDIIRRVTSGVAMNLPNAIILRNWLSAQIEAVMPTPSDNESESDTDADTAVATDEPESVAEDGTTENNDTPLSA